MNRLPRTAAQRVRRLQLDRKRASDARARAKRDAIATDEANLRLVVKIAESVHAKLPSQFSLDDLIGEGNKALLIAAESYDPDSHGGTPLNFWIRIRVRGAMIESVRRNKGVENSRPSIDDPGSDHPVTTGDADREGENVHHSTEAGRAFIRAATRPHVEESIDRERLKRRASKAIALLTPPERELLREWYGVGEPSLYALARMFRMTATAATEAHDRIIASLRATVNQEARPRAGAPKAA